MVVLDYRIVDVETSEIVATGEARGESKRTSKGFGAALLAGGVFAGGAVNMNSSNFAETIIGEATMDAVNKLAEQFKPRPLRAARSDVTMIWTRASPTSAATASPSTRARPRG